MEAIFGLGEALVSGLVNADGYKVRDGEVVAKVIAAKQLAIHASPAGGTQQQAIEAERQEQPALTDAQVVRLAQQGRRIEAHFGRPQDIEWCLVDDGFQIVQSRPITTLFPIPEARRPAEPCLCLRRSSADDDRSDEATRALLLARRIQFEPQSMQVIMAGMEATWWLNDQLQAWLGEKNAATTLTQSVPDNITSEMGLALLDVADVIRRVRTWWLFLQQVDDDGFLDELPKAWSVATLFTSKR